MFVSVFYVKVVEFMRVGSVGGEGVAVVDQGMLLFAGLACSMHISEMALLN